MNCSDTILLYTILTLIATKCMRYEQQEYIGSILVNIGYILITQANCNQLCAKKTVCRKKKCVDDGVIGYYDPADYR